MSSGKRLAVVGGKDSNPGENPPAIHDAEFEHVDTMDGGELHPHPEPEQPAQADVEDIAPGDGHNRKMGGIAAERLYDGFRRIENLQQEIKDAQQCIADIYTELQSAGFDKKACKEVIKRRKMSRAELEEQETLIDIYERAVELEQVARSEKVSPKMF